MFARVTTIQGQPDRLEQAISGFRDQTVATAQGQPGFQGAYLLVDRQQGTLLAISVWESEQAMQQSEQAIAQLRAQAAQQVGGTPTVARYEVAVAEGAGAAGYARVTRVQAPADRLEEAIRNYREQVVPAAQQQAGFQGAYLLADRQTGQVLSITVWESEDALRQSEQMAEQQRGQAAQQMGASAPTVERYEIAISVGGGGPA